MGVYSPLILRRVILRRARPAHVLQDGQFRRSFDDSLQLSPPSRGPEDTYFPTSPRVRGHRADKALAGRFCPRSRLPNKSSKRPITLILARNRGGVTSKPVPICQAPGRGKGPPDGGWAFLAGAGRTRGSARQALG